jgi:uncharacterized BrkB/YihY/UPF0761 family membrane protein
MFLAAGLSFNLLICLIPVLFFLVSVAGFVLSRRAAAEAVLQQLGQIVPVYRDELHEALAQIIRRRGLSGLRVPQCCFSCQPALLRSDS